MFQNRLLMLALVCTGSIAVWGIVDTEGLAQLANKVVAAQFESRGWFIMLTDSFMLFRG